MITTSASPTSWKDKCIIFISIEKDISFCENESFFKGYINDKSNCYWLNGLANKDPSVCNQISDNDGKNYCLASILIEPSYCKSIKDSNSQLTCYAEMGREAKEISVCYEIPESESKNICLAKTGDDISLCENIKYPNDCYETIAKYKQDSSICNRIPVSYLRDNAYTLRDFCYYDVTREIISSKNKI